MMRDAEFRMFADKEMVVAKRTEHFYGGNQAVFDENAEGEWRHHSWSRQHEFYHGKVHRCTSQMYSDVCSA